MKEQPNLNYLKSLSGGDADFENELLAVIKEELPEEIVEYEDCLTEGDCMKTAACVHKLKHKISILGLVKSYHLASDYENQLRLDNKALKNNFREILDVMVAYVAKL